MVTFKWNIRNRFTGLETGKQRESIHALISMLQVNAYAALINMLRPLLYSFYLITLPLTTLPPPVSSPLNLFLIFHLNVTIPPNSLYINNHQPHSLLCTSITPPEDELQHQLQKFVIKPPCPEEAFYFQIFYSGCPSTR